MILHRWKQLNNYTAQEAAQALGVTVTTFNSWLYLSRLPSARAQAVIELKTKGAIDLKAWRDEYHRKQDEVKAC